MFQGTIPQDMRAILHEHVRSWRVRDFYVGCSGNFTVERVLRSLYAPAPGIDGTTQGDRNTRYRRVFGNDVTIFSCALGRLLAGNPMNIGLTEFGQAEFGWLAEYLETPASAVAALQLSTSMLKGLGNGNAYYRRMWDAYRAQWPTMHEKTTAKLDAACRAVRLDGFTSGDVVEWVASVPEDAGFLVFPPFFAGDYESMFEKLEQVFTWEPPPPYQNLDAERRSLLLERVTSKREWFYGTHERQPQLEAQLRGVVRTTNRGLPIYVYASGGEARVVVPRQRTEVVLDPRLGAEEDIGERMTIASLRDGQFGTLRSQYMNAHIRPASASSVQPFAVLVDGKVIGAFAWLTAPSHANFDPYIVGPHAYLVSDFPIAPTKYKRLAKLVLYAALSKEAKLMVERITKRRCRSAVTTAFSNNPVSMKYRGLFTLIKRREVDEEKRAAGERHKWQMEYGRVMGEWTLQEGLDEWKRRHGHVLRTEGAFAEA